MVKYYYDKYLAISQNYYTTSETLVQDTLEITKNTDTRYHINGLLGGTFNDPFGRSVLSIDQSGKLVYSRNSGDLLSTYYTYGMLYDLLKGTNSTGETTYYVDNDKGEYYKISLTRNAVGSNYLYFKATKITVKFESTYYIKGSLVQANIQAEDGTYPSNGRHTDGYWYVQGAVTNQNPVITPVGTVPNGSMEVKPSFTYKVTDPDGNAMTVTESIDGIVFNTRTGVASGTQLTFTPTDLVWLRTRIKQVVNITITANDGNGGVTTVNYPITRTTPAIDLVLKTPFETNVAARRLLLKLEGSIPTGTKVDVQVCNNAFDVSPTWENATNLVLSGFPHPFTNKTKTATKWGVSFKVKIERGTAVDAVYLDGIGGAYD